jgi:dTDP-4-amino-4,6-dideoxygalactose transaminase
MKISIAEVFFPEKDKERISQGVREVLPLGWLTFGNFNDRLAKEFVCYRKDRRL